MTERPGRAGHRAWAIGLLVACAALPHGDIAAQPEDVDPFHWGYAAAFGTGAYRLGDGSEAWVVRAAFGKWLRETRRGEGSRLGVRLLLPVTFGVQNRDDDDLPPGRPTDRLEEAAFLPGIELELPVGERWTVRPRAQLGWGKELEGAERSARLAAAGVRSRFVFADAPARPAWISGLLWAGFDPEQGERQSLLRLTQAFEFDVPVPRWEFRDSPMRLKPHVLADWYYRPPPALAFGDEDARELESEWQVGLAAGREDGFRILWFEFESVGIAYRFSEHSAGLRFYLNSIF